MLQARFPLPHPVSLTLTLGPLRHGGGDPTLAIRDGSVWRATRTPEGPATTELRVEGTTLRVRAWGPGAAWAVEAAPALVGADDDARGFTPAHPVVADLARRLVGLRLPATGAVLEILVPTILAQKVTAAEATGAWRSLVAALGEPAPGPAGRAGLRLPPAPDRLAATPSWAFHPFGVERRRADVIRRAAALAARLEEAVAMPAADARQRLSAVPGIGPWTVAKVALAAFGDADAVCTGDYHLPHQVAWALAGEARADDARMLTLLEPYRGHRARVQRLLTAGGRHEPRFGPRRAPAPIAAL